MTVPTEQNNEAIKKVLPIILATSIFMQMLDSTILNTSLPSIAKDLNESPLDMQNAIISYVLTLALFMPVSGFLSDKFGTKKVFIFALSVNKSRRFLRACIAVINVSCVVLRCV